MDDRYLCPDCRAEHSEPIDAVLGHHARCLTCAIMSDGDAEIDRAAMILDVDLAA